MLPLKSTGHLGLGLELLSHLEATTSSTTTVTGIAARLIKQVILLPISMLCFLSENKQ